MSAQLTALLAAILWLQATAVPTGNHTCTGVVKHPVTVLVNVTEPVTFRSYTWCLRVPPRCSKYTVQLKDRVKLHVEMHNKTITVCCEGYVEMEGRCVPGCPMGADCPFMRCNRTNHCHCTPGYAGLYCNEACPRGLWGKDCKRPCDCPSGYTCHHLTGDCFVDDRPPRRTTATTTTTTTTTVRPTPSVTAPTTEGTTLETVKTPVFRFPPPPWVESAVENKKTTIRQVKKDEAPPINGMDIIQATPGVTYHKGTTTKPLVEISSPTLPTIQMSNTTNIKIPPSHGLIPPFSNKEEVINKKIINDSTNFKELEIKEGFPIKPLPSTIPLKITETTTYFSKNGSSMRKGATFSVEMTTTIPTIPQTIFEDTLELLTDMTETPLQINFTSSDQNVIKTTTMKTTVYTPAHSPEMVETESANATTTRLQNSVTQRPNITIKTLAPTQHILLKTNPTQNIPVESTFENEIPTQMFVTSINNHIIQSTEPTTMHVNISNLEPKLTVKPSFIVPYIKSITTTETIKKVSENRNHKEPTLNYPYSSLPVFINTTKSINLKENHFVSTLPEGTTLQDVIENKNRIENNASSSVLNNTKTPLNLSPLSMTAVPNTITNISLATTSSSPNQEGTKMIPGFVTSEPPISYDNRILKDAATLSPSLPNLTTATITTENLSTTPLALIHTTAIPTTIESAIIPTTTSRLPTTATLLATFGKTIPPTLRRNVATKITPTTAPSIGTSPTLASTSTNEPSPITELKMDFHKINASKFDISKEQQEIEKYYDTTMPQTTETKLTTVGMPTIVVASNVSKDTNIHKVSGQDKPKKKHEKIKPKNINIKEFPSIYQTKTEKHDETLLQQTTEISFRSILHAETFRNKILSTKSPTLSKIQPVPEFMNINYVTGVRPSMEVVSNAPAPSKPNQKRYPFKKQNISNSELKEHDILGTLEELSESPQTSKVSTEMNRVMESNTIDYRQSSEEVIKKVIAQVEDTNYSLIFNKIKFNMTESIAAGVKASRKESSYLHLPMILVLGIALVTLLLLTLTLWVYLRRRKEHTEPFPPCIMAYAMEEPPPTNCDSFDHAFFCPTFTNNYGEKINRELREMNYDHPRSSQPEPLYAEIFN